MLFTVDISNSHITLACSKKTEPDFVTAPALLHGWLQTGSAPEISTPVN